MKERDEQVTVEGMLSEELADRVLRLECLKQACVLLHQGHPSAAVISAPQEFYQFTTSPPGFVTFAKLKVE